MTAPERIWAQRGTLIGDHAENGYWEARNLYSHTMAEYIRADLHEAEIARLTAERDAALAGQVKVKPRVWKLSASTDGVYYHAFDPLYGRAVEAADEETCDAIDNSRAAHILAALEPQPITVQDAARVPEIKALIEAVSGYRRAIEAFDGSGSMTNKIASMDGWRDALDSALRAIAEQETQ